MDEMISVEQARKLVLDHTGLLPKERVGLLDASGRVAAQPLSSDVDIAPFAHSSMDGYAVRSADLEKASEKAPVVLDVLEEEAAGHVFAGRIAHGQCVRIMTGAPLPPDADAVVKQEVVGVVEGDGAAGSRVSFTAPAKPRQNVREAGEEAHAGERIVEAGEVVNPAGVGFLASCGITEVEVYRRPRVAVIATGSELVPPDQKPAPGKIRNSNSYAIAACVRQAGGVADVLPICPDVEEGLARAVRQACADHDFVVTTGGASNGDYDFIKPVVEHNGELYMTMVNMRPGKCQTFGKVDGTLVLGLPGNPAAAYVGFQMLVRPSLLKMQGFRAFDHPVVRARLDKDQHRRDPRRTYLRATLSKDADGSLVVTPHRKQSSGLFGPLQKCNCLAILPEGDAGMSAGDPIDCLLLDVPEGVVL